MGPLGHVNFSMYKTKLPTDVKERSFLIEELRSCSSNIHASPNGKQQISSGQITNTIFSRFLITQPMPMTCVVIMDHPTLQVGRSGRRIQAHARSNSLSIHRTTTIQNFLREHVVAIVHLVRDAKIQNTTTANSFRH